MHRRLLLREAPASGGTCSPGHWDHTNISYGPRGCGHSRANTMTDVPAPVYHLSSEAQGPKPYKCLKMSRSATDTQKVVFLGIRATTTAWNEDMQALSPDLTPHKYGALLTRLPVVRKPSRAQVIRMHIQTVLDTDFCGWLMMSLKTRSDSDGR